MARNVGQSPAGSKKNENASFDGLYDFEENNVEDDGKKEVNSWDSTSSETDNPSLKIKGSDWDADSDCRETMVEPFANEVPKECDDYWLDSDIRDSVHGAVDIGNDACDMPKVETKPISASHSSFNSPDLSILDVNDRNYNSMYNVFESSRMQQKNCKIENGQYSEGDTGSRNRRHDDDSLLVEDIEEFAKEETGGDATEAELTPNCSDGNDAIPSPGTPSDTTVWMIPKSERSSSGFSHGKLITASEKIRLESVVEGVYLPVKKAQSSSSCLPKRHRRKTRLESSKSDCLNDIELERGHLNDLSMTSEGSNLRWKPVRKKPTDERSETFHEPRVYFTEYECRTVTTKNDAPEKTTPSTVNSDQQDQLNENVMGQNQQENQVGETDPDDVESRHDLMMMGPSTQTSLEVVSLPDIIGRSSLKERQEKLIRRINSPGKTKTEPTETNRPPNMGLGNESWFLLDETGQYQPVTRDEVTILLNGRSADAVLQGHKEHFIQSPALPDMAAQNGSLGGMITKESIQNILREEDTGGEGQDRKPIDLERKVENTLLYIQPGINLTASIRIIPVDTEMIHIWRRSRDNGSLLSSEVDLRLQPSQDSVENPNSRLGNDHHLTYVRRMTMEKTQQTVAEQDESLESSGANAILPIGNKTNPSQILPDYSKLLIETRIIVDNLTNNFKLLQTRLDGETNRSSALQGEVQKLRRLLRVSGEKASDDDDADRETLGDLHRSHSSSYSSVVSVPQGGNPQRKDDDNLTNEKPAESENATLSIVPSNETSEEGVRNKMEGVHDTGCITVNIYTTEENLSHCNTAEVQETNSLLQTNLGIIERKMKRLEEENNVITKQNTELREKLKEISHELEKYLTNATETDECPDEDKDVDALRDQVCNLKLELDNLKKTAKKQERELRVEKAVVQEELNKNSIRLNEWLAMSDQVFREMENFNSELADRNQLIEGNAFDSNGLNVRVEPARFFTAVKTFVARVTNRLVAVQNENGHERKGNGNVREQTVRNETLQRVVNGYENLIEQCRRGAAQSGDQILDDYFAVIVEKASLMEEIKILKTENEILVQNETDHRDKLKETMIALTDRKQELVALRSAQKLADDEKSRMMNMLESYEIEKENLEKDVSEKNEKITRLLEENEVCREELAEQHDRLETVGKQLENLEKSCRSKDDLINELKMNHEQFLRMEEVRKNQMEAMKTQINDLEIQKTQLDSEMTSLKLLTNQSQKEMREYINHLETVVGNGQEALEKNKQKLRDSNQMAARLKTENEALERQNQCDLKLYNKTKEELEVSREKFTNLSTENRKIEEERERLREKIQVLTESEKEASERMDSLKRECQILHAENSSLKEKIEIYSKDRDESLKEQKDLINRYAILSREHQKVQEKYRRVKAECNDRTNVIHCLETMLRENACDYNSKIAYLENNITHILEKIAACKHSMREKHDHGVDDQVRHLREQLNTTCLERKQLEKVVDDYQSVMKRLENEVRDREKEVDELQVRLSLEQQKWTVKGEECFRKRIQQEEREKQTTKDYQDDDGHQDDDDEGGGGDKSFHLFKNERLEIELEECRNKLKQTEMNHENEKKKLELTIADLKLEINRYQLRTEVMMKNLSKSNKSLTAHNLDKRNAEEMARKLQIITAEAEKKDNQIASLNDVLAEYKANAQDNENELETLRKRNVCMSEMLKNLQNHIAQMEATMSASSKTTERQQREKNEIAEKLLQSIKIIMEEKSARQTLELLSVEKEKSFREQLDHLRNELNIKIKNCSTLSDEIESKKRFIFKLQYDLKKLKLENAFLKTQVTEKCSGCRQWEEEILPKSNSLTQIKIKNFSPERLESCLRELKEIREVNLVLRKTEGEHQAKIVRLEDEIRDARLIIKELQGGLRVEKKSRKALRNMITSAKMEIDRCLAEKQLISMVADRINRYLDLEDVQCRGFRGPRRSNSSESYS